MRSAGTHFRDVRAEDREMIRAAARRHGLSVGEWLDSVIKSAAKEAGPPPRSAAQRDGKAAGGPELTTSALHKRIDHLAGQIEQLRVLGASEDKVNPLAVIDLAQEWKKLTAPDTPDKPDDPEPSVSNPNSGWAFVGTSANDIWTLQATNADEKVAGLGGDDVLSGFGGADILELVVAPPPRLTVRHHPRDDVRPGSQMQYFGKPARCRLWIASDAPDTDFTAKLIDVHPPSAEFPHGFAMNLTEGLLRVRYRDSWERPTLMEPGAVYAITIELFPVANLFCRGHRLRLDISSSNFPHFDVNPNSGEPEGEWRHPRIARNRIFGEAARPSHILLPVIPPGE